MKNRITKWALAKNVDCAQMIAHLEASDYSVFGQFKAREDFTVYLDGRKIAFTIREDDEDILVSICENELAPLLTNEPLQDSNCF